jgi:hypothetical protein
VRREEERREERRRQARTGEGRGMSRIRCGVVVL